MTSPASQSILDVGCGKGSSIVRQIRNKTKGQYVIGCDVFPQYVKESRQSGLYNDCILAEACHLPFNPRSFELIFCLEVIEHLTKSEGEKLLQSLEGLSSKKVALSTPVGFMYQSEYENNPYQIHKSAWFPSDFRNKGYKVAGMIGPFFIRKKNKYSIVDKYIVSLAEIASFLLQPLFYLIPDISFQMICVKKADRI